MNTPSNASISKQDRDCSHFPSIPVWPVLASILIHSLVATSVWYAVSRAHTDGSRLRVSLRRPGHTDIAWSTDAFPHRDANIEKTRRIDNAASERHLDRDDEQEEHPFSTDSPDEVYLPQELLTQTAIPIEEIDLQGVTPPGPGFFRMRLWISRDGLVTRIDLEDSGAPIWFTDHITEKFWQSRFIPGIREHSPVASILRVEITF